VSQRRQARGLRVTHRAPAAGGGLVELTVLAREARIRTESASRFVALGLPEPSGGTHRVPLFAREAASILASAERLRRELGLNHAGAVLAYELLARIEELEARLESLHPPGQSHNERGP
jgi:chaperone modulatory protein CbpM